jgi:hypothetical protein
VNTRESLGIFWEGAEADGFTVYAYFPRAEAEPPVLQLEGWEVLGQKASHLGGEGWTVCVWDVRIREWPPVGRFPHLVRHTLSRLVDGGAAVSWCGVEGAFAEPSALFAPGAMSDGVWAACSGEPRALMGPPALDGPFFPISNEQLKVLALCVSPQPGG